MTAPPHSALAHLAVQDDELVIGGTPLTRIAERVGRTPFYVYDRARIDARVSELRSALPRRVAIHYAMKANPMPAVVAHLASRVDGVDVASAGELAVALDAGAAPGAISFAGPGKRREELEQALAAGILVNVESLRELAILAEAQSRSANRARVAVRVNPDFELKTSGMRMGGGPKQFGIDAERVPDALAAIASHGLDFEGFHIFTGSQSLRAEAICEAQSRVLDLAVRLAQFAPGPVRLLNMGGGFGIPYFPGDVPLDVGVIGRHLESLVARADEALPGAALALELGRYLVGEAGVYVCRVIDRKISRGHVYLVTDGGLHHNLAASGNFGQVIRKNYPVVIGNRVQGDRREIASVVGPLCTPLDLLADHMDLAQAREGDLVAVLQSGAYGMTASPHAFLSHPPPLEVLV